MKRMPLSKGIHVLPSLFTTGNMFCSFFSIVRAINGDYRTAAWAIFVASFFDMIDGRLARMTKTQSDFGREYDSLVDLASFGLAPAILAYTWTLQQFKPVGWVVAFLFFTCAALRLARFNTRVDVVEKKRFQGLPTPPAACAVASLVLFYRELYGWVPVRSLLAVGIVPLLALLMVSSIRYRSFKEFEVRKGNSFYVLIGAAVILGVIAINPGVVLFLAFTAYALSGPVEALFSGKDAKSVRSRLRERRRKLSLAGRNEERTKVISL